MEEDTKRLDFLSEWQSKTFVALGEGYLRERNSQGEIVFEILMWAIVLREILELKSDFKELNPESAI